MKQTPLPKLLKKTQIIFNAYVRSRDKDKGCISCGGEVSQAGHYFAQGHYSSLRFSETNTNGQCVSCNMYKSGNLILYRRGLVERYGEMEVKRLEDYAVKHKVKKWSRPELLALIQQYSTVKN